MNSVGMRQLILMLTVQEASCLALPPVSHGEVTPQHCLTDRQQVKSRCKITCDTGYSLQGSSARIVWLTLAVIKQLLNLTSTALKANISRTRDIHELYLIVNKFRHHVNNFEHFYRQMETISFTDGTLPLLIALNESGLMDDHRPSHVQLIDKKYMCYVDWNMKNENLFVCPEPSVLIGNCYSFDMLMSF